MARTLDTAKKPRETHAQYEARLRHDAAQTRDWDGPLVTPEAEQHARYEDVFVTHIETNTKAYTKRSATTSPLARMHQGGTLTDDQYSASLEIAAVVESLERDVAVRGGSLAIARVDNSGSARDVMVETVSRVRLERLYAQWREQLPMPRRLVIDMVTLNQPLHRTAARYGVPRERARRYMIRALDRWCDFRERIWKNIGEEEVLAAHARIGAADRPQLGTTPER